VSEMVEAYLSAVAEASPATRESNPIVHADSRSRGDRNSTAGFGVSEDDWRKIPK